MEEKPIRVIVFGSSGTGKTSMVNELTGENGDTNNNLRGCTFKFTHYECVHNGQKVVFTDTVGLNEDKSGTVSARESFYQLLQLIKEGKEGWNLMIMVHRGRLLRVVRDNYELFVVKMCQKKIPVLGVVTGLETEKSMDDWVLRNPFDIPLNRVIGTCFGFSENEMFKQQFQQMRKISAAKVWSAIDEYATKGPIPIYTFSWKEIFISMWNYFTSYIGQPGFAYINEWIDLFVHIGCDVSEAIQLASMMHYPDLNNIIGLINPIMNLNWQKKLQ